MNLVELEKQLWPIVVRLAENPAVKAEMEAAFIEIIRIVKIEAVKSLPVVFRIILKVLTWINKNIKGAYKTMEKKFNLQRFADTETTTTGNVTITVQNSAETVLSGATVSVTISDVTTTATTGTDGTATFSDLAAGSQTFTATLDGYTSNTVDVTVEAGDTVSGTIALIATTASAVTSVITAVLSELSDLITNASTEAVATVITELEDEIDTTSSLWVKVRDNMEKAVLVAIKSIVISTLVSVLTDKIESYLEKVLANEAAAQK